MARARNIKPGFFKNEELVELPFSTRLLFIGLWTVADREGRLEDKPKRIKMEIFPADDVDVEAAIQELVDRKFLVRYRNEEGNFLEICSFKKHQNPHYSEKASTIKPPDSCTTPGVPRESSQAKRADSLNPDSLNPEKSNVGLKPDPHPSRQKNGNDQLQTRQLRQQAIGVLEFLNEKTGRNYRPVVANVDMIVARLKDGATVDDCRAVIAKKAREWGPDEKMNEYLRPATLFNRTKFAQYQGELGHAGT